MRLIVNENVSGTVIRLLREHGHDVISVKESMRGCDDGAILARAELEGRILVTHDKDFGELAFRFGLPARNGIILLRLSGRDSLADNRRASEALYSAVDWAGKFAVVTDDRIRLRALPSRPDKPR